MNPGSPVHPIPDMFSPVSAPAAAIRELWWLLGGISGGILLVVGGVLWWCATRFRARPGEDREPPQVYGSDRIEFAWTIVPILIVFVLFLATARTIYDVQAMVPPADALEVTLVGHQWWWEIRYPGLGVVTANELHVPASVPGARRPTFLTLESADVIHSFWVPQLAGKTDVVPATRCPVFQRNLTWALPSGLDYSVRLVFWGWLVCLSLLPSNCRRRRTGSWSGCGTTRRGSSASARCRFRWPSLLRPPTRHQHPRGLC